LDGPVKTKAKRKVKKVSKIAMVNGLGNIRCAVCTNLAAKLILSNLDEYLWKAIK
jgi:bacterioferritin-associated ferredoxin